jgi:hypothetical protein
MESLYSLHPNPYELYQVACQGGGINKCYVPSLIMTDINDVPEFMLRRTGRPVTGERATPLDPKPLKTNDLIGLIYWQPWGSNGAWGTPTNGGGGLSYGRSAQIAALCTEDPGNSRGGRLVFFTNQNASPASKATIRARALVDHDGKFALLGRAANTDNSGDNTINIGFTDFVPTGWLNVAAPNAAAATGNDKNAISIRGTTGSPGNLNSYGVDYQLDYSTGSWNLYRYNKDVATPQEFVLAVGVAGVRDRRVGIRALPDNFTLEVGGDVGPNNSAINLGSPTLRWLNV